MKALLHMILGALIMDVILLTGAILTSISSDIPIYWDRVPSALLTGGIPGAILGLCIYYQQQDAANARYCPTCKRRV